MGVHPNAAFRNEVGHFGKHGGHQLLDEVDLVNEDVCLAKECPVASDFASLQFDLLLGFVVEINGVFGVLKQGIIRFDAVRHIRVDKRIVFEVGLQLLGVVGPQELEEFEEVNDLVVPPVADVGPGIVGLNRFPFETIFEDAVGVVAVERGGVEELENHAFDELGVGVHQGFPVLEDVAPVALVVQNFRTGLFVAQVDGKAVPRTAGVAVPAAEFQRQVFGTQSLEVEVIVLARLGPARRRGRTSRAKPINRSS